MTFWDILKVFAMDWICIVYVRKMHLLFIKLTLEPML